MVSCVIGKCYAHESNLVCRLVKNDQFWSTNECYRKCERASSERRKLTSNNVQLLVQSKQSGHTTHLRPEVVSLNAPNGRKQHQRLCDSKNLVVAVKLWGRADAIQLLAKTTFAVELVEVKIS